MLASVVATACFCLLTRDLVASRTLVWANITFALAAVVDVVVGRVAFAVGLALALLALLCWHRGGKVVALLLAVLTPLASPVAATFVALAGRRSRSTCWGEPTAPRCGRGCAVPRSRWRWRRPPWPRWR